MVSKCDDIWPFNDRRLTIQTTVFSAWIFLRLAPGSKCSNLIGTMSVFNCLHFGHYFTNGVEIVRNSYFKQLFQNLRPKSQYSKIRIFLTSHFGALWLCPHVAGYFQKRIFFLAVEKKIYVHTCSVLKKICVHTKTHR